jgi:tyrosyl-tRNA synthetase
LAWEIVRIFHDSAAADRAAADAAAMYQGEAPSDTPDYALDAATSVIDILVSAALVKSRSEARRLIQQGGVRLNGEVVSDVEAMVSPTDGATQTLQAGKRRFLRLVTNRG